MRCQDDSVRQLSSKEMAVPMTSYPSWESYHPTSIDITKCIGRRTKKALGDTRWKPVVYGAQQCTNPRPAGGDLCAECIHRRETRPHPPTSEGSRGCWQGVVTDMGSLPAPSHIAGSEWCRSKPKWRGSAVTPVAAVSAVSAAATATSSF